MLSGTRGGVTPSSVSSAFFAESCEGPDAWKRLTIGLVMTAVETPTALKHLESIFCWCNPIVEVDEKGRNLCSMRTDLTSKGRPWIVGCGVAKAT